MNPPSEPMIFSGSMETLLAIANHLGLGGHRIVASQFDPPSDETVSVAFWVISNDSVTDTDDRML